MENKSYIKYTISGISKVNLKENCKYKVNNDVIDFVEITKELNSITLYLKKNNFDKATKRKCSDFIEEYLLKLCLHPDIEVDNPSYGIDSTYIINSDAPNIVTFNSTLSMKCSCEVIHIYNKDSFYNKIFNNDSLILNTETSLDYKRLMSILKNSNKVTRYLLLYELLLDLASRNKSKRKQKNIANLIEDYNTKNKNKKIKFYKTRKKDAHFYEDAFTYYRNQIAHAEFEDDYEKYEKLTNNLSHNFINSLIDVINFAICVNLRS